MKKLTALFLFCIAFTTLSLAQITITLQPNAVDGKDAVVHSNNPDGNNGTTQSNTAYTWTNQGALALKRFFIAFDLSAIPTGAVISSAELSLFYNPTDPSESFDFHEGDNKAYIKRVNAAWEEDQITWSNQPKASSDDQVYLAASTSPTQDYLDIEVTKLVIEMHDPSIGNHGFVIQLEDEINYYQSLLFASSDHPDDALHPKLVITYTTPQEICTKIKPNADYGKDAVVYSYSPDSNHGDRESNTVYTWTNQGNLALKRFFLAFDFSSIPNDASITAADLSLFYNPTDPYESFDFHEGNNEASISRVISDWEEDEITWNNQPNASTDNQVYLPKSSSPSQDYLDVDVTDMVIDMHDPSIGNYGFVIQLEDEVNYYKSLLFASSDHPKSIFHPELNVCWLENTTAVENILEEANLNFRLFPNPTEGDFQIVLERGNLHDYQVEIYNALGQLLKSYPVSDSVFRIDEAGIYFVRLVDQRGKGITKKLVVSSD